MNRLWIATALLGFSGLASAQTPQTAQEMKNGGEQKRPGETEEQKGKRDGVSAYGLRMTSELHSEAGRTTTIVAENWFSMDLGLNLDERIERTGENSHRIRLHDLQVSDPDDALFHVPQGYTVPTDVTVCGPPAAATAR